MALRSLPRIRRAGQDVGVAAFVDVETTGLSRTFDEIVEFAIVLFAFDPRSGDIVGILDEYVGLRDPGRPIPKEATAVHGIWDEDVRGKRLDQRRIRSLIEQAEFLVAHNASFDRAFVERLFPEVTAKSWLCSMNGIPWKEMGFRSRGLQNLLADHNIRVNRAHRGLDDVKAALVLLSSVDQSGTCYFKYVLDRYQVHRERIDARACAEPDRPTPAGRRPAAPSRVPARSDRFERERVVFPFPVLRRIASLPFRVVASPFRRRSR